MTTGGNNLGSAVLRLVADATGFNKDLSEAEAETVKRLDHLSSRARTMGLAFTAAGAALVAPLAASTKVFADFEQAMANVRAVSGATEEEMARLTEVAERMGATTVFTARQAAEALSFMAMAGLSANESITALPDVLNLAAAGNLALAEAADIVTNVMSGYGIAAEDVTKATDVLTTGFTSANTDLVQLGLAFKYAGPVAKAAGVDFEETTAALSLMGNAGLQASMAGTGLRGAISRLLNPSSEATEAMNRLGVSATDASGNLLPLHDIVGQFETVGLSAGDAMTIFGQRAGPAMLALIEQGSGALVELTGAMEDSGGTAQRIADTQLDTLSGQVTLLTSAAEGLANAVGQQLAGELRGLVERTAEFLQGLTQWMKDNPRLAKTIVALVAVLGMGLGLAGVLTLGGLLVLSMAANFITLKAALIAANISAAKLALTMGLATGGLTLVVGLATAALAGLFGAFGKGENRAEDLRAKLDETTQMAYDMREAGIQLSDHLEGRLNKALEEAGQNAEESAGQIDEMETSIRLLTAAQLDKRIEDKKDEIQDLKRKKSQARNLGAQRKVTDLIEEEEDALRKLKAQLTNTTALEKYEAATDLMREALQEYYDILADPSAPHGAAENELIRLSHAEDVARDAAKELGMEWNRHVVLAGIMPAKVNDVTEATEEQTTATGELTEEMKEQLEVMGRISAQREMDESKRQDHLESLGITAGQVAAARGILKTLSQERLESVRELADDLNVTWAEALAVEMNMDREAALAEAEERERIHKETQEAITSELEAQLERRKQLILDHDISEGLLRLGEARLGHMDFGDLQSLMEDAGTEDRLSLAALIAQDIKADRGLVKEAIEETADAAQRAWAESMDNLFPGFVDEWEAMADPQKAAGLDVKGMIRNFDDDMATLRTQRDEEEEKSEKLRQDRIAESKARLDEMKDRFEREDQKRLDAFNFSQNQAQDRFEHDRAKAARKFADDQQRTQEKFDHDREVAREKHLQKLDQMAESYQSQQARARREQAAKLGRMEAQWQADREAARQDHYRKLEDIRRSAMEDEVDAELARTRKREDIERDYQRGVEELRRRLGEQFFDTPEADITGILSQVGADTELLEAHLEGMAELQRKRDMALEDSEIGHERRLQDIARERERREQEALIVHNEKLSQLDLKYQQDRQRAIVEFQRAQQEAQATYLASRQRAEREFEANQQWAEEAFLLQKRQAQERFDAAAAQAQADFLLQRGQAQEKFDEAERVKQEEQQRRLERARDGHDTLVESENARHLSALASAEEGFRRDQLRLEVQFRKDLKNVILQFGRDAKGELADILGQARRKVASFNSRDREVRNPHELTRMAKGGLVTGPTRALLGEEGPELVLPLDKGGGIPEGIGGALDRFLSANWFPQISSDIIRNAMPQYDAPSIDRRMEDRGERAITLKIVGDENGLRRFIDVQILDGDLSGRQEVFD